MSIFETELKKGNFVIPECPACKELVWPPSDYCSLCFGELKWKKSDRIGKILEYSRKEDTFFCLAEFEKKIRIIGTLKTNLKHPDIGKKVKLDSCSINGMNYNFTLVLI